MNDLPRQKLCEIITQYGQSVYDNPQRCEGLLRDFCGQYRKEIAVLIGALKDEVPSQLQALKNSVPHTILLARLKKRLEDNLGLGEEAATWAVESWALALGVISEEETRQNKNSVKVNPTVNPVTQPIQDQTPPQPQVTPSVTPTNQHPAVTPPTQPSVTFTQPPITQPPSTRGNQKAIAIGAVGILALMGTVVYFQGQQKQTQEIAEQRQREEAEQRQREEIESQLAEEQRKRQEIESQLEVERQKSETFVPSESINESEAEIRENNTNTINNTSPSNNTNVIINAVVTGRSGRKNIRSGPGTVYSIVGTAYTGDAINVMDSGRDRGGYLWYRVYHPASGTTGWIAAQLVNY